MIRRGFMKTVFKVWNILIIAFWGIMGLILLLGLLGIGSLVDGASAREQALGGAVSLIALFALVTPVVNVIMCISGLRGKIGTATKIAYVLLALDAVNLIVSDNKGMTILRMIVTIGYVITAKKSDTYAVY